MRRIPRWTYRKARTELARRAAANASSGESPLDILVYSPRDIAQYDRAYPYYRLKLKQFNDGDYVWALSARASSSQGTYGRMVSKDHGYVLVSGRVEVLDDGQRIVEVGPMIRSLYENPTGWERTKQLLTPPRIILARIKF